MRDESEGASGGVGVDLQQNQQNHEVNQMNFQRFRLSQKLKVNIKSLAAESQIIRHSVRALKAKKRTASPEALARSVSDVAQELGNHRRVILRAAQRASLLAYAAVRGVPYNRVEMTCNRRPDWEAVRAKVHRLTVCRETRQLVDDWIAEAKRTMVWIRQEPVKAKSVQDT